MDWLTARPIAHRGYHDCRAGCPENTLAAFRAAIDRRYAIECDLHPSADGVPIAFHDDDLDRLTGEEGPVRDRTAAALAGMHICGTSKTIPTLARLLELVRGAVPLVLELKSVTGRDEGFAAAVAAALAHYAGPVAVMSFDHGLLADLRAAAPRLPCGLTAEGDRQTTGGHLAAIFGHRLQFVAYSADDLPAPAPRIARRLLGLPVIAWNVRTPQDRARAAPWADQIIFEGFEP